MAERLRWSDAEEETAYVDDAVSLTGTFHDLYAGEQPARARTDDALVWVWGDVYGLLEGDGGLPEVDGHVPRSGPPDGSARYVADLYDDHGGSLSFASRLNGDFLVVVYDREAGTVSFVTDRVASRPAFYTRGEDGAFVFASNLQALVEYPDVEVQLDLEYVYEYLLLRRVFGVKTPLEGVEELPPASVVTVDPGDRSMDVERYWRPTHDPVDASYSTYVERFTDLFERVVTEWTRDDLEYGVLLSGGSDSRLVLGAMDRPATAFHIADWASPEARVAERTAEAAGVDFHLLERDEGYHADALDRNPDIANFSGWFDQGYFTGFDDEIADEVDVLLSGLYADMLFKGGPLSTPRIPLGRVGSVSVPVWKGVDSIDEYVAQGTAGADDPPAFVTPPLDVEAVVRNNVDRVAGGVDSHGVTFESLRDLVLYGDFFPMGADTDAIFSRSLTQMRPYRTPFLDARILEFQQRVPLKYFLRRNLVHRAVERIAPDLADVPHSRTGVPLKYPYLLDQVGDHVNGFRRKHLARTTPPQPHLTHGPWTDRAELLRHDPFVLEWVREREALIRDIPFLDYEGVLECYESHMDGEDRSTVLYSLATFLGMPTTERAARSEDVATRVPAHLGSGPGPAVGRLGGGD